MVNKQIFRVLIDGKNVSENIASIALRDSIENNSDEITLDTATRMRSPTAGTAVKVWFGESRLTYFGSFSVTGTERTDDRFLQIKAAGADFSGLLKERRTQSWDARLEEIIRQIAARLELGVIYNPGREGAIIATQNNETDISFLKRYARSFDSVVAVKDGKLFFGHKSKLREDTKRIVEITASECVSLRISKATKVKYKSCEISWQDTKHNKRLSVVYGSGRPVLKINKKSKNKTEALVIAEAQLKKANENTAEGNLTIAGKIIFAGNQMKLSNTLEDDGIYLVKSVNHKLSTDNWETSIEFSR